jgi:ferrochelatase
MAKYQGTPDFRHDQAPSTGVLLVNLGTPDAPTPEAVRRFLAEFLWDPRVVEMARPLWWLILHGVILRLRPSRVAKAYQTVWTEDGSPLLSIAKKQAHAVREQLSGQAGCSLEVALAMRYGNPSIEQALDELRGKGMQRLLVLPLYPQYSATTTASIFDEVFRVLSGWRWVPELRLIQHYHDHPAYIDALAASVTEHWNRHGRPDRLLMSFHGIPRRYFNAGDPYFCECQKTGRLLAERLELQESEWQLTFQSRFGREEWLRPYTDHTLKDWGKRGVARVDVVCPGFSADCLETLEEIAEQNRELFLHAGGKEFRYISALNERLDHARALSRLLVEHMHGWEDGSEWSSEHLQLRQLRARSLGAEQ